MSDLENKSKSLSAADDSAARLLIDLLDGSPGRNFDIESLFLEKKEGKWRFVIFEFLKSISVSPEVSHPNFYWYKNKRKFLSLWTVVKVFHQAGYGADLYLVNYLDDKTDVKLMKVLDVNQNSDKIIRSAGVGYHGYNVSEVRDWVSTEDEVMSYSSFKDRFRSFNDRKLGDTWDLLYEIQNS